MVSPNQIPRPPADLFAERRQGERTTELPGNYYANFPTSWKPYYHQIYFEFPFLEGARQREYPLPIPPESIGLQNGQITRQYQLVGLGEAVGIGGRRLQRLSWKSHLVVDYDESIESISQREHNSLFTFQNGRYDPAYWWIYCWQQTQIEQTYCRVTIANAPLRNQRFVINDLKYEYVPGPSGDIWYELSLVEYRQGFIKSYRGDLFQSLRERPLPFGKNPSTHVTTGKENIRDISIRYFGTEAGVANILRANESLLYPRQNDPLIFDPTIQREANFNFRWTETWNQADVLPHGLSLIIPQSIEVGN